jgi:hypothetical protein
VSIPPAWPRVLEFFGTPLVIEPSPSQLSSDARLLPIRQFDQRIGLTKGFAEALDDPRDPALTEHSFPEMVRSRVYGILAGYADQNDHDTLRTDPVFKLVADRSPEDDDLASQPGETAPPANESRLPAEALTGAERQRHFRLRRQRDPLGGTPLHLAHAADQGGGGSHHPDAADRNPAVIKLASPGLVSPRVRARA